MHLEICSLNFIFVLQLFCLGFCICFSHLGKILVDWMKLSFLPFIASWIVQFTSLLSPLFQLPFNYSLIFKKFLQKRSIGAININIGLCTASLVMVCLLLFLMIINFKPFKNIMVKFWQDNWIKSRIKSWVFLNSHVESKKVTIMKTFSIWKGL